MIPRRARGECRCIRRARLTINRTTRSRRIYSVDSLSLDRNGTSDLLFRAYRYPRYFQYHSPSFSLLCSPSSPPLSSSLSLSLEKFESCRFCKSSSAGLATCSVRSSNHGRWLPVTSAETSADRGGKTNELTAQKSRASSCFQSGNIEIAMGSHARKDRGRPIAHLSHWLALAVAWGKKVRPMTNDVRM